MFVSATKRIATFALALLAIGTLLAGCGREKPAATEKTASPEQLRQVERLNAVADEMYRHAMAGEIDEARDKLDEIGVKMTEIRFDGIASVEGVGALSESIVQAKRIFNAITVSREDGQLAAAKIRLATDALTHADHPMWLQYYRGMKETVQQIEQAVQRKSAKEAAERFKQLEAKYAMIRPSLFISKQPSDVEKLDSLFTFLRSRVAGRQLDAENAASGLAQLHTALDELFGQRDRSAFVPVTERPVPLAWVLAPGSIIVSVLAFAAWRIFRFERRFFR